MTNKVAIAFLEGLKTYQLRTEREALDMAIEALEQEPKRGKWIIEIDTGEEMLRCSECDNRVIKKWYRMAVGTDANKCPYCGVRMEIERRKCHYLVHNKAENN